METECRFCKERSMGETVSVESSDWWMGRSEVAHYGPIFYCPLCGKRLTAKAVLDGNG